VDLHITINKVVKGGKDYLEGYDRPKVHEGKQAWAQRGGRVTSKGEKSCQRYLK
jgi:hypothetical protein